MTDSDPLREEFVGVDEVVPETLLALSPVKTLHLPAHDRDGPACGGGVDRDWRPADTEDAITFGAELCRACFERHFDHLARDPDSPVERVGEEASPEPFGDAPVPLTADGGPLPRLESLTEEVARVAGGGNDVYHAPAGDRSLCGARDRRRRRPRPPPGVPAVSTMFRRRRRGVGRARAGGTRVNQLSSYRAGCVSFLFYSEPAPTGVFPASKGVEEPLPSRPRACGTRVNSVIEYSIGLYVCPIPRMPAVLRFSFRL